MNERLKVLNFKYNVGLGTFIFFFIIFLLAPLSGIDWGNYVRGSESIVYIFNNLNFTYGGFITSILASLFSYNKLIFDFVMALLLGLLVKNVNDVYGKIDNKYYYLAFPFILLLVGVNTFAFNYTSVYGAISSTVPSILIIIYFIYLYKKEINTEDLVIKDYIVLILLSLLIVFDSFYLGIGFLVGNILIYIYGIISNKKIKKNYYIIIILQLVFIIINSFLCPKELLYDNIPVMINNIPNFIDVTFSKNILLFIISAIPINFYLNNVLKDYTYKRVIIVLFDLLLVFSLAYNFFYYSPVNLNLVINKYKGVFALENIYYIFYFIFYMILYGLSFIHFSKKRTLRNYLLLLVFISIFVSMFKLLSPSFEDGNSFFFVLSMGISTCIMFNSMNFNVNLKAFKAIFIILIVYYIGMMSFIRYIDYRRDKYIREQLKNNSSVVEVYSSPIYYVYRYNPVTIFEEKDFRLYYDIPSTSAVYVRNIEFVNTIKESVEK